MGVKDIYWLHYSEGEPRELGEFRSFEQALHSYLEGSIRYDDEWNGVLIRLSNCSKEVTYRVSHAPTIINLESSDLWR